MPDVIAVTGPSGPLRGVTPVPGDKSITHRALLLGALAEGDTRVRGWVPAEVCRATLRCVRALGVSVDEQTEPDGTPVLLIHGAGLQGLREPADVLDCAGSGTTMRLLAGLLAGQAFHSVLTGSEPLRRRPMGRIVGPLRLMGATVLGREGGRLAPLTIQGGSLRGIDYSMPVASAQVKSAILLAALFAEGETVVREPGPSRDHTERMLRQFGVTVDSTTLTVGLAGRQTLHAPAWGRYTPEGSLTVPGDFSSAAFPLVAAAIVPGSEVTLRRVGINPTRTGLYDLMAAMGAEIPVQALSEVGPERTSTAGGNGEPVADLEVRSTSLRAADAHGDLIVRSIDEFPVFAVAATQARGITTVREAAELRVKESDRISSVAAELRKMGADIEEWPDGMVIRGPVRLTGAVVDSHRDHRLAMALAVAGLVAEGETVIHGAQAIDDSFPGFVETMRGLGAEIEWRGEG